MPAIERQHAFKRAYRLDPAEGSRMRMLVVTLLGWMLVSPALAEDVYLVPDAFLAQAFEGDPPEPAVIWLSGSTREVVEAILAHRYRGVRIRYWQRGDRTAWILEEIGKERPITTGLVVDDGALQRIRVLVYRESRGWEVRHDFFTDQFNGAQLTDELRLDRPIDGISGATLSVRALTKLARVALYLHQTVVESE